MKKVEALETPVNVNERFLYGIALRLEILIEQLSGISEHLAKRDGVATVSNVASQEESKPVVEEVKPKVTRTRKKV